MLVIGSLPCAHCSMLQELNKFSQRHDESWLARLKDNLIKAIDHINFCIKLYKMHINTGDTGCASTRGRPSPGRILRWKSR